MIRRLISIRNRLSRRKKLLFAVYALLALMALALLLYQGNTELECNTYTVASQRLPDAFDGYRIALVSDLHNTQTGSLTEDLLDMLRQAEPDMIAITGDLIDYYQTKPQISLAFVAEAVKIAPCYFVSGNHEARYSGYGTFRSELENLGVQVLADTRLFLEKDGDSVLLIGIEDTYPVDLEENAVLDGKLQWLVREADPYTVVLSHRPVTVEVFASHGVDLVLSGHMHGGQFRLPFIGGIYTPSTGFFPEYDAGLYTKGETYLIVSRGIGNSIFPLRVNNPPELIIVQLQQ